MIQCPLIRAFATMYRLPPSKLDSLNLSMMRDVIAVGCSKTFNICESHAPVRLVFNKDPSLGTKLYLSVSLTSTSEWIVAQIATIWPANILQIAPQDLDGYKNRLVIFHQAGPWMTFTSEKAASTSVTLEASVYKESTTCMPARKQLSRMFDSFEDGIYSTRWEWVSGGGIGFGCGALIPYAHGKTLYFNGCGHREARTVEMDLNRPSKIMFVMQIGCRAQTPDCNVKMDDHSQYRGILLQYSTNKGADWRLIARHDPADYLSPKRLAYDIPHHAQGVQFRWWQPVHGGEGSDQWALDHVEIV
ncbi:LOW QUALITY PROTEIN: RELN-like protein, partial [Mya arenaria]